MGEAALVRQDAHEGALLVEQLDASGFRLTAAFWAHDAALDIWRLVLAAPRLSAPSPRAAYSLIQTAINELDLSISLDRVTFVPDTEPLIGTLRDFAAAASSDIIEVPLPGADIAGAPVDIAYAYSVEALLYEKDLLAALQRNQPNDAILRRAERELPNNGFDFDFLMGNSLRAVLIVAKALPRKLSDKDTQRIIANYRDIVIQYARTTLLIVSKTGFVSDLDYASSSYGDFHQAYIALVKWAGMEDDVQLRASLARLLIGETS